MEMTRRVAFNVGHRAWNPAFSAEENCAIHGPGASPYNHGHDVVLDVAVRGETDETTGMVVNIKKIDAIVRREVAIPLGGRSLNDEVPWLDSVSPTLERLALAMKTRLAPVLPPEVALVGLTINERPGVSFEVRPQNDMVRLTRSYEFAAAHRLHAPSLSEEENVALYGKCHHAAGHGHNYALEVTVEGTLDPVTGLVISPEELDDAVEREILSRYDHRNLDMDVSELAGGPTTSERVVRAIADRLAPALPVRLARVTLWETPRNAFTVDL